VIQELDHDLRLGFAGTIPHSGSSEETLFPLYSDPDAIRAYSERLERSLAESKPQDHLDLGVAFMEMELYELAVAQFKSAFHKSELDSDRRGTLVATALWAEALIRGDRAFDAMLLLQPIVRDMEVASEDKVEFVYLTGRAYEAIKKPDVAFKWYEQVRQFDPGYRDIDIRIRGVLSVAEAKR
jgi:tetratricopeptide (TPR) repeat protein